ncbi:helix-turn-helix domain-containing protein [Catalinimonas sp. 4WD22]|uniref:helix-turn-helix domain-containing protein n=1 Tax=Catalinimonas locisalis TaxID=3133978 RepID=UPI00310183EE
MEQIEGLSINSAAKVRLQSLSKQFLSYNFSCTTIDFDLKQPYKVCFPSVGCIFLVVMNGENFQQSFHTNTLPDTKKGYLHISGLISSKPMVSSYHGKGFYSALKIHPVICHYFLKENMRLFTNQHALVTDILLKESKELRQLENNQDIASFDNLYLERFLLKTLPCWTKIKKDPIYHAVNTIIKRKGMIKVRELADEYCMSERTLNRQFIMKVGISPKAYAKICQWQYVTTLLQKKPLISLQDLSYLAGYYDNSHLVHDFKDRTSSTPSEFQQQTNCFMKRYLEYLTS